MDRVGRRLKHDRLTVRGIPSSAWFRPNKVGCRCNARHPIVMTYWCSRVIRLDRAEAFHLSLSANGCVDRATPMWFPAKNARCAASVRAWLPVYLCTISRLMPAIWPFIVPPWKLVGLVRSHPAINEVLRRDSLCICEHRCSN